MLRHATYDMRSMQYDLLTGRDAIRVREMFSNQESTAETEAEVETATGSKLAMGVSNELDKPTSVRKYPVIDLQGLERAITYLSTL